MKRRELGSVPPDTAIILFSRKPLSLASHLPSLGRVLLPSTGAHGGNRKCRVTLEIIHSNRKMDSYFSALGAVDPSS